jgi:hypothetical protein
MDESVKAYKETYERVFNEMPKGKLTYQMPNRRQRKKILKQMKRK